MSSYDTDDGHDRLVKAYGQVSSEEEQAVADLAPLHDGANAFLALCDQSTDDEGTLPDDLDGETKRQLKTAQTLLSRALTGLEETAAARLNEEFADD